MSEESPDAAGKSRWPEIVGRHHQFLLEHMDPDFGLLTKLVSKGTFSYDQQDDVITEKTVSKRNGKLLDIIRNEDKWDDLMDALRSSNQIHVVKYLEADGKHSSEEDWPLGEREENILRANLEQLIDLIEVTELVVKLYTENVINKSQREFIQGKETSSKQNEAFLNILRRRSIKDYNRTIYYLKETNQPHIAQLLREGGGIVRVHVSTDAVHEEERQLVDVITDILGNRSVEERRRILRGALAQLDGELIAAKPGQSIILFVYLQTIKQLNHLKASLQSGSLKNFTQLLFKAIKLASKQISVSSVAVANDELSRVEDCLQGLAQNEQLTTIPINIAEEQKNENTISVSVNLATLDRHKEFLEETIELDSGMLDKLFSTDKFTRREILSIEDQRPYGNRIARLLQCLTDQKKCDFFVESLRNTGQTHIVNYLIGDGIFKPIFGGIWPITDYQRQILKVNENVLVSVIEVNDDLMSRLQVLQAISQNQKGIVDSKSNTYEKAEAFLKMLHRMNQIDFRHAMKCLCDRNRSLRTLDEGGVFVRLQINSDATTDEKVYIVIGLRSLLGEMSTEGNILLSELNYVNIIKVEIGQNIIVYVTCRMMNEFLHLQRSLASGALNDSFGKLFAVILIRKINVFSIIAENEDDICNFFKTKIGGIELHNDIAGASQRFEEASMEKLHLELLDCILQKCYLCCALQINRKRHITHQGIIIQLASVNVCWFKRLMKRNFKLFIYRKLFGLYRNQRQRHLIIRNNSHYFESSLQQPNQIRHLKFSDCITDVQSVIIQRQGQRNLANKAGRRNSVYAHELLEIVKSLDESRYSGFIRCLRQTGRRNISRIVANGGAVIPLICWIKVKAESKISDMAEKLWNKLKQTESEETKLRELDALILDISCERQMACWIWCRSTNGLEKLKETDVLKTTFTKVVTALSVAFKLNLDSESFDKIIAFRSGVDSDSPLMGTQLKVLNANQKSLIYQLEMTDLLSKLSARNVINLKQKELIDSKRTVTEKNRTFLNILQRLSKRDYALTIDCLYESSQIDAAQILEGEINLATLVLHKSFFEKNIDLESGLLDKLLSTNTLTPREIRSIIEEPTYEERNAKLLEYITDQEKCVAFVESLRNTSQNKVFSYLNGYEDQVAWPYNRLLRFQDYRAAISEAEMAMETEKSEGHGRVIQAHYNQLLNSLTSTGDIIVELFRAGYLAALELEYVQSFESTPIRANAELLYIILKKPNNVYENFLKALRTTKQQDAYLLLTATSSGQHLDNFNHSRLIRQHYDWLTRNIECDTGLTARLFEKGVLTLREIEYVGAKTDQFIKNEALLSIISRKSSEDFFEFQQALIETGQNAVVDKLTCSHASDFRQIYESDENRILIQRNFVWLAETIELHSGIIEILYQEKVITFREREIIHSEKDAVRAKESLLKIISQKSATDFEQFLTALRETKQDHVVLKLMEERAITVGYLERKHAENVIHGLHRMKPNVPLKPGKQHDGPKERHETNVPATDHPPKAESPKIRSISFLQTTFEKLEPTLRSEIALKISSLRQRNPDSSQNVFQTEYLEIHKDWQRIKSKEQAQKTMVRRLEFEKGQLYSELEAAKETLAREKKLRWERELQNNKIFEQTKSQFQKDARRFEEEIRSMKFQIDTLNSLTAKANLIKETAEQDLHEERKAVLTLTSQLEEAKQEIKQHRNNTSFVQAENRDLKIAIEKYKSHITTADNRSSELEGSLHILTDQLRILSTSADSYFSMESERLDTAIKKIIDLEKKVNFAAGEIASNEKMAKDKFFRNLLEKIDIPHKRGIAKKVYIARERLELSNLLGKGHFGHVYAATLRDTNMKNPTAVAVKILEDSVPDKLIDNVIIMEHFNHPRVLSVTGICFGYKNEPMVILPFMSNGDLRTYIKDREKNFTARQLMSMIQQVAEGMSYLSSLDVIHRNLAARNCMIDELHQVKVADFGLSYEVHNREYFSDSDQKTRLVTKWMAIESLDNFIFTVKSDVWSFGVLMWEVMTRGIQPYPDVEISDIENYLVSGRRLRKPQLCPDEVYAIMMDCWRTEPEARPTFTDLVNGIELLLNPPKERSVTGGDFEPLHGNVEETSTSESDFSR